jgi:hypothetical protein
MPGGRHRRFQIMGINHFKYATRRESDRLAHRLRTQVVLARRSNTGAASKRKAMGRCPSNFVSSIRGGDGTPFDWPNSVDRRCTRNTRRMPDGGDREGRRQSH